MALTVFAAGQQIRYIDASVIASMKDASRHFSMTLADDAVSVYPGTPVTILGDSGQLLLTGFSNTYEPKFDANSHTITVTGRSTIQDTLDSSVDDSTGGQYKKKTPVEIANMASAPFGGAYVDKVGLPKIDQFHQNPCEGCHQVARRLAQNFGCTIRGTADGNAEFCTAETATSGGTLSEGHNILSATGKLDDSSNYSEFQTKSQLAGRSEKYGRDASANSAKAKGSATRMRRLARMVDRSQDEAQSQKQATWMARQTEARAKTCSITVQGDAPDGIPVDTNMLMTVVSPWLGIAQQLVTESVTWKSSESGGTTTDMTLVSPEAYGSQSGAASQKSAATADGKAAAGADKSTNSTKGGQSPMSAPSTLGEAVPTPTFGEF